MVHVSCVIFFWGEDRDVSVYVCVCVCIYIYIHIYVNFKKKLL